MALLFDHFYCHQPVSIATEDDGAPIDVADTIVQERLRVVSEMFHDFG